jgi:hypothetical protein
MDIESFLGVVNGSYSPINASCFAQIGIPFLLFSEGWLFSPSIYVIMLHGDIGIS